MFRTIAFTVLAGLLVGAFLPFAVFGSHEVADRIENRSGPKAHIQLQARQLRALKVVPERRIPAATSYKALAGSQARSSAWSQRRKRNGRTARSHRRHLDSRTKSRIAAEDRKAWLEAVRLLRRERSRA